MHRRYYRWLFYTEQEMLEREAGNDAENFCVTCDIKFLGRGGALWRVH